ncbi:MAG: competence/damage-inducible protein A [Cyanobacteria bacterium]|nr:competence/damage-inducible protein A [Cyanobacteriota bacterium]
MQAEIIAVGTELLLGEVVNTNAAWISQELASLGVNVRIHVTVGDNPARIQQVIAQALERSNILIFTGGLGPTDDDLTVATIADYFKTPLAADPESEETIRSYFIARGMPMSKSNIKQALKPVGADTIKNPVGTAPGILWDVSDKVGKPAVIATFPGVPKELYAMWPSITETLRGFYTQHGENPEGIYSSFLHFFGIGESKLGELLRDLMQAESPTVAPYVGQAVVKIRLAAKAPTREEALAVIEPVKQEVIRRAEPYYFGEGEMTLEKSVAAILTENHWSVSTAESCTGGLLSSRLTDVPGSSQYTHLNLVTYSNAEKHRQLGVPLDLLETFGAVSPEVANAMVLGLKERTQSDVAIALTGIAGPDGGTETKPVGLVYIGMIAPGMTDPIVKKVLVNPRYGRVDIKYWFTQYALHYLRHALLGRLEPDQSEANLQLGKTS